MCIIAAKPAGIELPSKSRIANMWYMNPDGAGIMYAANDRVRITKGLMTLEDFQAELDKLASLYDLTKIPMVMHFRITTHGGTCPENTHPFPVTEDVSKLRSTHSQCKVGVAHNGIIPSVSPGKGISDTMEYIATQLAPLSKALPDWYTNKHALRMVENAIDSKLAILDSKGNIVTIGNFNEHKGVLYSNYSHNGYSRYSEWDESLFSAYGYDMFATPSKTNKAVKKSGKTGKTGKSTKTASTSKLTHKTSPTKPTCTVKRSVAPLMWVGDTNYVKYKDEVYSGESYAMDDSENVYLYDTSTDSYILAEDFYAYGADGKPLKFVDSYALLENIIVL